MTAAESAILWTLFFAVFGNIILAVLWLAFAVAGESMHGVGSAFAAWRDRRAQRKWDKVE